jgi:predicted lipoprotein with Yx(FWY)xxD motif
MRRFLIPRARPLATLSSAALLAATLAGCSSSAKPDPYKIGALPSVQTVAAGRAVGHWVKKSDGTVRFAGTVAAGSAAEFTAALTPQTKGVVATVTGGDLAEGLAIGRALHDRKLTLTIEGACAGPCADYWFPAAASRRTDAPGGWLGYTPDLAQTAGATAEARAAEAKLYADSGVDSVKFHTALDSQLREVPGAGAASATSSAAMWMPDRADLVALGYPAAALAGMWLPPNLASANAHAHAWGQIVAYKNTLVGLPPAPAATAAAPPAPSGTATASASASPGAKPSAASGKR